MVSAVSSFIPYGNKEEAESFLITRKDESSWLYDAEKEDFIKIAESGDEVESVFPDGKSVYVNKEGDLYKCQIGREDELVLEDCGNVEKVTQEGQDVYKRQAFFSGAVRCGQARVDFRRPLYQPSGDVPNGL